VLPAAELRDAPVGIRLDGEPIVLWRSKDGRANGLLDRCAHRFSPLSAGKVRPDGRLACPYHGFHYDGTGAGMSPSSPEMTHLRVPAKTVVERYGYLWVAGQDVPEDRMPNLGWDGWQWAGHTRVPFAAPLHVALDNFSEDEHTPWVHGLLGWTAEQAPEVEFHQEQKGDQVEVLYRGPQRPSPWLLLLGAKAGDLFENDWITRFDPVHITYTLRWYEPTKRAPRPVATRFSIFMVPTDARTTVFHVFLHVKIEPGPYTWIAPIVRAVSLWLGHREIAFDGRFIPTVADTPYAFQGMQLGRFDKPLVHNHRLLDRVYRGVGEHI
jgi:phenylpropionate dioxygenase-like ring-hydroxylating dioxygenase large terminal subunit